MARYYGIDVQKAIYDFLVANYNNMIATINSERTSTVIPCASFIRYKEKYQFPEMYIDIIGSTLPKEEIFNGDQFNTEIFDIEVKIAVKENVETIIDDMEIYIEAMIRLLDNISMTNITSIIVTRTNRNYFDNSGQILRVGGVQLEVRVN